MFKSNLFIVLVVSVLTLFCAEFILRAIGLERFQTWLELTERGTFQNRAHFEAWGQTVDKEDLIYQFDAFGNRITSAFQPSDSLKTVAVFGDSFAFGLYLPDSITITERLNKKSPNSYHFINAGVGGSGSSDHLIYIQNFLTKQSADEIILLLNYDDVDRAISKNLFVLKEDSLLESKRWDRTSFYNQIYQTSWFAFLEKNSVIFARISKFVWSNLFFEDDYKNDKTNRKYIWPSDVELQTSSSYSTKLWIKLIQEMKHTCDQHQTVFKVATTGFKPNSTDNPRTFKVFSLLEEIFQKEHIPFLTIQPIIEKEINSDWNLVRLKGDSHPNAYGTQLISKAIYEKWYE